MERVLLDTNIYGKIIEYKDELLIRNILEKGLLKGKIVMYGNDVIRNELRDAPKDIKIDRRKVRTAILNLFDMLTEKHRFKIDAEIKELADNYFKIYKKIGGTRNEREIINDFVIVASAAIKKLDIIYSEDSKTMMGDKALESYSIVNEIKRLRNPRFRRYLEFISDIRRLLS